jgi:DNA-binding NarL/FixJ family response regulator
MIKVAIVEDKKEFRELWRDILNNTEGFVCIAACETEEIALKELPIIEADVVLMDINLLPNGSGISCVRQLHPLCPTTEFMMFTIFEDDDHILEALKAGATGYILKNTSPTKVLEAIQELKAGGSPMSSSIARRVLLSHHEKPKNSTKTDDTQDLTPKEIQILELLAKGYIYKEIADKVHTTVAMVKQHLHKIYKKLHVSNRTEALNKFYKR